MVLKQILTSNVRSFVPPSIYEITYNILTNVHDDWEACTVPKEKKHVGHLLFLYRFKMVVVY